MHCVLRRTKVCFRHVRIDYTLHNALSAVCSGSSPGRSISSVTRTSRWFLSCVSHQEPGSGLWALGSGVWGEGWPIRRPPTYCHMRHDEISHLNSHLDRPRAYREVEVREVVDCARLLGRSLIRPTGMAWQGMLKTNNHRDVKDIASSSARQAFNWAPLFQAPQC